MKTKIIFICIQISTLALIAQPVSDDSDLFAFMFNQPCTSIPTLPEWDEQSNSNENKQRITSELTTINTSGNSLLSFDNKLYIITDTSLGCPDQLVYKVKSIYFSKDFPLITIEQYSLSETIEGHDKTVNRAHDSIKLQANDVGSYRISMPGKKPKNPATDKVNQSAFYQRLLKSNRKKLNPALKNISRKIGCNSCLRKPF